MLCIIDAVPDGSGWLKRFFRRRTECFYTDFSLLFSPVAYMRVSSVSKPHISRRLSARIAKQLELLGCDRLICPHVQLADELVSMGYKRISADSYMRRRLADILPFLAARGLQRNPEIVLYDPEDADADGVILKNLCEYTRLPVCITQEGGTMRSKEAQAEQLYITSGVSPIVTDEWSVLGKAHVIVSLSRTQNIINRAQIPAKALFVDADAHFKPAVPPHFRYIDSVSLNIPSELREYVPDAMRPFDFIAALYEATRSAVLLGLDVNGLQEETGI